MFSEEGVSGPYRRRVNPVVRVQRFDKIDRFQKETPSQEKKRHPPEKNPRQDDDDQKPSPETLFASLQEAAMINEATRDALRKPPSRLVPGPVTRRGNE